MEWGGILPRDALRSSRFLCAGDVAYPAKDKRQQTTPNSQRPRLRAQTISRALARPRERVSLE